MFFLVGSTSSIWVAFLLTVCICFCIFMTLFITNILSSTILKGEVSSFVLELPHYRKPQIFSILVSSFLSKTLSVLWKAIKASIPAAIVIWCSSVFMIHGENLLSIFSSILNPIGELLGLDGTILLAFLLAFPANEIVVPALLMIYLKNSTLQNITDLSYMKEIFIANGWNMRVACCFLIFMLFHFPCATTLITIKEETKSFKWSVFAFLLPLIVGFILCILCKNLFLLFGM
jgi:ferrous iron transport protein B